MRNISQGSLLKVLVPNMSAEEQRQAVQQVEAFSASMLRLRSDLFQAQVRCVALRRALLSAAFSGRLRDYEHSEQELARV